MEISGISDDFFGINAHSREANLEFRHGKKNSWCGHRAKVWKEIKWTSMAAILMRLVGEQHMNDLPDNWAQVTFEDVAIVNPRKSVDLSPDDLVTFVPMAAVSEVSGTIVDSVSRPLREVNRGFTQFANKDVIFAKITPSMENGKSAVAADLENGIGFGSTEFHVIRSLGAVLPEYLWHFVRQMSFREDAKKVMSGAVGQQRVPANYLKEHPLPLPPIAEQKRIVEKINSLVARAARAHYDLQQVPLLVEQYKSRILADAYASAGSFIRDAGPAICFDLGQICDTVTDGDHQAPPRAAEGIPFITIAAMNTGRLHLDQATRYVPQQYFDALRPARKPAKGDVLFSVTGSIGIPALVEEDAPFVFQRHIAILKVNPQKALSQYVRYILAASQVREQVLAVATGTAQLTVPLGGLRKFKIPVPSIAEQQDVVDRIDAIFAGLDRMCAEYTSASKLLPRLDALIRSKAFRGELLAQNPNDEPASALITRTRSELREMPKVPRRARKRDESMNVDPKSQLLNDSEDWPERGLPYEEISRRHPFAHDEMRDAIFSLLAEKKPRIRQIFDKEAKRMYLQRVKV